MMHIELLFITCNYLITSWRQVDTSELEVWPKFLTDLLTLLFPEKFISVGLK